MSDQTQLPAADLLVVDDTPETLLLLTRLLRKKGYRVRMAEGGYAALAAAEAAPPELVLLDVMMPDMDGYEVCRRMREMPALKDVPVLFVSALGETNDKLKAFASGGLDYVTKPFQAIEVLARVETHLALRHTRLELEGKNDSLQLALAENGRLMREMRYLAETDSLTGVPNRGRFFTLAEHEFTNSVRYRRPMSVIMLDIDHFKKVNDTHGHAAGDEVLRVVARAAQAGLRESDVLGRYGGEEFAILLPTAEIAAAYRVAERLREKVAEHPIDTVNGTIRVTISLGVAEIFPTVDKQVDHALQRADQALYTAKRSGRNRAIMFQPEL